MKLIRQTKSGYNDGMEFFRRRNMKVVFLWIFFLLALAGTFAITKKLGQEGENIASVFLGRGAMHKFFLSEGKAEPASITASPGDEIVFMVLDDSLHNMAEERSSKRDARLESGEFGVGESYVLSFSSPGMYSFYDRMNTDIHVVVVIEK